MFPTKKLEGQMVSDLPLSIPCPQNRPLHLTTFCEILQERMLNIVQVTFPAQNVGLRRYFLHLLCIDTPFWPTNNKYLKNPEITVIQALWQTLLTSCIVIKDYMHSTDSKKISSNSDDEFNKYTWDLTAYGGLKFLQEYFVSSLWKTALHRCTTV